MQLLDKLELAYICVDEALRVTETSRNLSNYGFQGVDIGDLVTDTVDFMVGMNSHTALELPLVHSPANVPISVSLLPAGEKMTILIANATLQAQQRQQLQQAANENELLVDKQKVLMRELESASRELEAKNRQLEEASRLQTSFLSGVSHEFRTPLTSIIGYTNLVKQGLIAPGDDNFDDNAELDESAEYLEAVHRSSKHLLSLVENLLDHGKLDAQEIVVRPKPVDLAEVFEDVELLLRPLCTTKNIDLSLSLNFTKGQMAVVDDSRLRQCLINLVGNAIKFTDEGFVEVSARWNREILRVAIRDSGPGIAAEDLEKIRLPFWQAADTGKAGTGLGLTITEKIIELMGGRLSIGSEVGEGTTVMFDLPISEMSGVQQAAEPAVQSLKVLLAEDDSDIADLVTLMLAERGITVTRVENGALALDEIASNNYDLVLMDIHMPVMTGYEAIERLRAESNNIPVVVMSASALDQNRIRAEELGCDGYLIKPVDVDDIILLANQVVANKEQ